MTFQVRHLLAKVRGCFSDFEGVLEYDQQQPEHSSVSVTAKAASIDTNEPDRDAHLRSADFFDVEQYPPLTFTGHAIGRIGKDRFDLAGDLTIHGVTRRVTFAVDHLGKAKAHGATSASRSRLLRERFWAQRERAVK